jgi:hypothetical protein
MRILRTTGVGNEDENIRVQNVVKNSVPEDLGVDGKLKKNIFAEIVCADVV